MNFDLWLTRAAMLTILFLALVHAERPKPAVTIAKETKAYSYDFSWSREAKQIAPLDALLRERVKESLEEIVGDAEDAYEDARKDGRWFPETGYISNWNYATAGQSSALLSLAGEWFTYTGGAHGIFGATTLLWDRVAAKEIAVSDLFETVSEFALLHPAMCDALKRERKEKRESEEEIDTNFDALDSAFNGCPKFDEVSSWIADEDGDGLFDTMMFAADPYVAGPYAEGAYEMKVPVTARLVSGLKPAYRESFEAQPQ